MQQFEQLVDQLQNSTLPIAPHADRSEKPNYAAWIKSKVLPYIDLYQWREDLPDGELKKRLTRVALASALGIEPDTLTKVTMRHAEELTVERSWTFKQLVEDAIGFQRTSRSMLKIQKTKSRFFLVTQLTYS